MAKAKAKAIIKVANSAGEMAQVQDRRFEGGEWPISVEIQKEQADTWLQYFSAEYTRRGWSSDGIAQIEARENSGSLTVNSGAQGEAQLAVIWERKRDGPLKVRARSAGVSEFPLDQANEFFQQVNERCAAGAKQPFYQGWMLCYEGLPWRGELWLDQTLRLGPPRRQYEAALYGPRIILVDALVDGIDYADAGAEFKLLLRELSVFLSVVMRRAVRISPNGENGWTWIKNASGKIECDVRSLSYFETDWPRKLPEKGVVLPVPLVTVQRPDVSFLGLGQEEEQRLPNDVIDLWQAFTTLPPDKRRQFLQAGNLYQLALSLTYDDQTTRYTMMVAACEALKPPERQFNEYNIYNVVEGLLGNETAAKLKQQIRPQEVRSEHIHLGRFRGNEFVKHRMMSRYQDRRFYDACDELAQITPTVFIEWLTRGGVYSMPSIIRQKSWRRWLKDHVLTLVSVGVGVGIALGWFLRMLWLG
jgi:hypothetical protein